MDDVSIRRLAPGDHAAVIAVLDDWWGGRRMRDMLPRLFFVHFCDTSFVAEQGGGIAGFLVGFASPCRAGEAYVHFVGVHPRHRNNGLGRTLYAHFFDEVRKRGCREVRCVTSPGNQGSIAFHRAMGFQAEHAGTAAPGVPIAYDYDGPGEHRVLFVKTL